MAADGAAAGVSAETPTAWSSPPTHPGRRVIGGTELTVAFLAPDDPGPGVKDMVMP